MSDQKNNTKRKMILHRAYDIYKTGGVDRLVYDSVDVINRKQEDIFSQIFINHAIKSLNKKSGKCKNNSDLVDLAMRWHYGPISLHTYRNQKRKEILWLLKKVGTLKPKIIIEIGSARGGNIFLFSRSADKNATIISIDLPTGESGLAPDRLHRRWRQLQRGIILPTQRLIDINENSQKSSTRNKLASALKGRKADFLFIDGDHSYEAAMSDFKMYSPFVRKGGIVAFHDIHGYEGGTMPKYLGGGEQFGSVAQWEWMKKTYPTRTEECIEGDAMGIGVFKK